MENKTAIEFKNVSKVYKLYKNDKQRFRAIFNRRIKPKLKKATDDVSFTIREGESVALFGRNGGGKIHPAEDDYRRHLSDFPVKLP